MRENIFLLCYNYLGIISLEMPVLQFLSHFCSKSNKQREVAISSKNLLVSRVHFQKKGLKGGLLSGLMSK